MLSRSASSRRRRQSRSGASGNATSPRSPRAGVAVSPGRRASIAVSPVDSDRIQRMHLAPELSRSPRHSIIPDISFESNGGSSPEEDDEDDVPRSRSLSPRNSLVPGGRREYSRSARNSLVPDVVLSPRNSLTPECAINLHSPRNSLIPECALSPRNSLIPDGYNVSPRNSLVPEKLNRSPRHSLTPDHFNRSPRNSLVPENRSPRPSLTPDDYYPDIKSARGSPRGSVDHSPRGSIVNEMNRSPRGTKAMEENGRSPRGSLTLTFQDPPATDVRRYSADNSNGRGGTGRSVSPYRSVSGVVGGRGTVNMGYSSNQALSEGGSRRASSSVSQTVIIPQVSGDEQRRLCSEQKKYTEGGGAVGGGLSDRGLIGGIASLTTYGSVAYQLKDANLEANGTCDFVCKALSIVNKTVVVTVILVCLSTLPVLMLSMGLKYFRDCPREPHIPVYMVVGGGVGCVKMIWTLYNQLHTRRPELGGLTASSVGSKVAQFALLVFLAGWFALGNYWILRIRWPDYAPTLFEPNRWCHRTLYVFGLAHLCVVYGLLGAIAVLIVVLAGCQLFGCPWLGPTRFK